MIKVSRAEVLHIAKLSRIEIDEQEINELIKDLEEVLTYASRVQEIASGKTQASSNNINLFRPDEVAATNAEPLLANAPQKEEHLIVVPVVLE